MNKRISSENLVPLCSKSKTNVVLKGMSEIDDASVLIHELGLQAHNDRYKNWDLYHMFSFILQNGTPDSVVLDMGCAAYGVILPSLEAYGFTRLYGCDLVVEDRVEGDINFSRQNLHKTNYPNGFFDFITSSSVIEHGVDIGLYLKEAARLLKPGGYLLTTADYWPSPIDTKGIFPYGDLGEMKIFTQEDIEDLFVVAAQAGLHLIGDMDFSHKDKVVHWERVDKKFTFIYFVLTKNGITPEKT